MRFLEKYYNQFRYMNPKNTQLKLILIVIILVSLLINIFSNFKFSWDFLIFLVVFIISITCHEVAHGYVAYKFGDDTAKTEGRLSLNPLKHLDIAGLIFPLLLFLSGSKFFIGWAKPVPVNFYKLKPNRLGRFLVAAAGIIVNLFFALISGVLLKSILSPKMLEYLLFNDSEMMGIVVNFLLYSYMVNLILALFNMIPVTPLDCGRMIHALGNDNIKKFYDKIEKYGLIIVFAIVYTGIFSKVFIKILIYFLNIVGINLPIELL